MSFVVGATDAEADPLTHAAYFLQAGMAFDPLTRTFTWSFPTAIGKTYYVKFMVTTPSGGTDAIIDAITVYQCCAPHSHAAAGALALEQVDSPNPTGERFSVMTGFQAAVTARLTIFDVAGRRVATIRAPAGKQLLWDGRTESGNLAPSGIYLYHMEVAHTRRDGKFVIAR